MISMSKSYLLTETDAVSQYRLMIEEYSADNSVLDKGNALRTRFDIILNLALKTIPGTSVQNGGFMAMVDRVLPGTEEPEKSLNARMHRVRKIFNEKVQHRFELEQGRKSQSARAEFSWNDFIFCLEGVSDLVAYLSGIPIPPELKGATMSFSRSHSWHSTSLDVVVLVELFTGPQDMEEGIRLFKSYQQMLNKCRNLHLRVRFHLITYSPALTEESSVFGPVVNSAEDKVERIQPGYALERALSILDESLQRRDALHGDKPWFFWLSRGLPDELETEYVSKMEQLMTEQRIAFYPVALRKECVRSFEAIWPSCGPYTLNSRLSANFFLSLLDGIHKLQSQSE